MAGVMWIGGCITHRLAGSSLFKLLVQLKAEARPKADGAQHSQRICIAPSHYLSQQMCMHISTVSSSKLLALCIHCRRARSGPFLPYCLLSVHSLMASHFQHSLMPLLHALDAAHGSHEIRLMLSS